MLYICLVLIIILRVIICTLLHILIEFNMYLWIGKSQGNLELFLERDDYSNQCQTYYKNFWDLGLGRKSFYYTPTNLYGSHSWIRGKIIYEHNFEYARFIGKYRLFTDDFSMLLKEGV